jgi:hypothetical protein
LQGIIQGGAVPGIYRDVGEAVFSSRRLASQKRTPAGKNGQQGKKGEEQVHGGGAHHIVVTIYFFKQMINVMFFNSPLSGLLQPIFFFFWV